MSFARTFAFRVNGRGVRVRTPPLKRLLDVLRYDLELTGTKEGCGEGECGACTVLIDGEAACSCLVPICQVEGAKVETVERLAGQRTLSPLASALVETGGTQCGICTPGFLVAAHAFLSSLPAGRTPTDSQIRTALAGNLCRCTGYQKIVEAVRLGAKRRRRRT